MAEFELAVRELFDLEGGYSNDPDDAGGRTKYGITQRSYPELDIKALKKYQARDIYLHDFWIPNHYGFLNSQEIATKMLALAAHTGPHWANKILQRALRAVVHPVKEDGILGPVTWKAANTADHAALLAALRSETAGYYRLLCVREPRNKKYIKGWLRRAYA